MNEFDLIDLIRARADRDSSVVVGIGDDAAVLRPTAGNELVATTDNLVAGRHFDQQCRPENLGHLALAVNLSDLAAMGASPRWLLLSLTLPEADRDWLDAFLDGFLGLAGAHDCVLVGGNLACGPLNVAVTALGEVAAGQAATRSGACAGDRIVVTGSLGDGAAALEINAAEDDPLRQRLLRPEPRLRAGRVLAEAAHAMIDVSDGLLADLAHLLGTGAGATLDCTRLPASGPLIRAVADDARRWRLQLTGGSDYELLALLPPQADRDALACAAGVALTEIGRIDTGGAIRCLDAEGCDFEPGGSGWDHFGS